MAEIVECGTCGAKLPVEEAAVGFNVGAGPEYICPACAGAPSVEQIVELFHSFCGIECPDG